MSDLSRERALALHRRAQHYNWDAGTDALWKIIRDPNCDRATALMIYWKSRPEWDLQYAERSEVPDWRLEVYDLQLALVEQYERGFYQLQTLSFDPRNDNGNNWTDEYPELQDNFKRSIPPLMYEPVEAQ
jgi:hypothetical protein